MRDEIASAPHVAPQIQAQPVRHPTPAASVTPTDGAADESLEERIAIAAIADKDAFDQIFVTHARGIDGGVRSLVVPTRETLSDGKVRTEVFVSSNGPVYDPEEI